MRMMPIVVVAVGLAGLAGCGKDDSPAAAGLVLACAASPAVGIAPQPVALDLGPAGTDSVAVRVQWGDGASSTEPFHVYLQPGRYVISATATRAGASATCSTSVTVQEPPPRPPSRIPSFKFKVNPSPASGPAPLTVGFNACETVDPDGDRLFYRFDFGDGRRTESTFCRRDHTYGSGRYSAVVCATDGEPGHEGCATFDVMVQ